jgi:hypothetical protein
MLEITETKMPIVYQNHGEQDVTSGKLILVTSSHGFGKTKG